jgi:integrase
LRAIERLSARTVASLKEPGKYPDGAGLYLQVATGGSKSWIFRYRVGPREREMGLGSLLTVSLAEAREAALQARKLRHKGIDPIEARQSADLERKAEAARAMTFDEAVTAYLKTRTGVHENAKHAAQWPSTLKTYASPHFGKVPVNRVDTPMIISALEKIWTTKTETASRVRGRIERVLDWATVSGLRQGENPARWKGHLDMLLPAKSKVARVEHHTALPFAEVSDFMTTLRAQAGQAARALELTILTAARTSEVIEATWKEVDLEAGVWTVPAERMKAKKEHRVPLCAAAVALLKSMSAGGADTPLFEGQRAGRPLSNMAMLKMLERMGRKDLTVHGFRSTFRDWAAESTAYPNEVVEMALAHTVSNKVEAAYRRGDLFEKRRALMEDWGKYVSRLQ